MARRLGTWIRAEEVIISQQISVKQSSQPCKPNCLWVATNCVLFVICVPNLTPWALIVEDAAEVKECSALNIEHAIYAKYSEKIKCWVSQFGTYNYWTHLISIFLCLIICKVRITMPLHLTGVPQKEIPCLDST